MKQLAVLLILTVLTACSAATETPLPSAPIVDSVSPVTAPPTATPNIDAPTGLAETDMPAPASTVSTFPNPDEYTWQLIVSGLERPVDLQADGSGRLYVIEKTGRIRIIEKGQLLGDPFLNIEDRVNDSSNEMGLLGLAFHPDYAQNGYFYVNYTGTGGDTFISRFQTTENDPYQTSPLSEVNLLRIKQPFPNHNGGSLAFGPDGYLYAGLGDGGLAGDPFGNAQKTDNLLGKILRLDVNLGESYSIPAGNPFDNEIWAYGLRNPWRISFDMLTGDLFIADVGQGTWEEVDYLPTGSPGGANFGWDFREGKHDYDGKAPSGLTEPIAEYSHAEGGCSVTGGYVYRGSMPAWNGVYLYGDYCTGFIWGLIQVNGEWQVQLLFDAEGNITSFGQDEVGEVYLVTDGGNIFKLIQK